jgi:rRNA maturation protein Nop10
MYLMMYLDEAGKVVYTLKARAKRQSGMSADEHSQAQSVSDAARCALRPLQKEGPDGKPTQSAHPARFSPDDKFSRVRLGARRCGWQGSALMRGLRRHAARR